MTKDVKIIVLGHHDNGDGDAGTIRTTSVGQYFEKGDSRYLIYDEEMEGFDKPVHNRIKYKEGYVELVKSGLVSSRMVFEQGKTIMTNYNSPYGELLMGVNTKSIHITQWQDMIRIEVDYSLEVDEKEMSKSKITIKIKPAV
ncbi:MAG: DUF1934 domain-containing protein [Lachnospiraceae bacterium]|nr:DUF1934 domain-containing protein [Lachnospiraceae bacterium]